MFALRTKGKYENEQITLLRDQWWQALTAKKKSQQHECWVHYAKNSLSAYK